jgi:hypothetical protein
MNRLCEYDLIDLQNAHDGDYGFVLVYQDYLTKFTQLRPLKSKSSVELGTTLMDLFCIFGPPLVLQSSADLHIENSAIQQTLEAVWPGKSTRSIRLNTSLSLLPQVFVCIKTIHHNGVIQPKYAMNKSVR